MNSRERFRETLLFGKPDKIPFSPGGPRESTLRRWRREGLPEGAHYLDALYETLGLEREPPRAASAALDVDYRMIPQFEERVLEHRDGHYLVRDWMGAVVEISDEYDYTYLRQPKDFVTRKWHQFPVAMRDDWERMKERYDPRTPGRFPADFDERCARLRSRDFVLGQAFNGPYWQLREWLGFENLSLLFLEDPDWIRELIAFWTEFVAAVLEPVLERVDVDLIHISEDMAFKAHPMIGPKMAREFLQPAYDRWVALARQYDAPLIDVDSDGYVADLLPVWLESGVNVCDPVEVAAGNDIAALRERFGRRMAFRGGIDKRCIAKGGAVIERELERVIPPLLKDGGFIPGCDHGVPHDISWPNYVHYARLLAQYTGWL